MELDNLIKRIKKQELIKLIVLIILLVIFMFIFEYFLFKIIFTIIIFQNTILNFKNRKQIELFINNLSKKVKELINYELKHPLFISKYYYILTDNYIINLYNKFAIIKYKDIIWTYQKPKIRIGRTQGV